MEGCPAWLARAVRVGQDAVSLEVRCGVCVVPVRWCWAGVGVCSREP